MAMFCVTNGARCTNPECNKHHTCVIEAERELRKPGRQRIRATPEFKALVADVVNNDAQVRAAVDRLRRKLHQWGNVSFVRMSTEDARTIIKALEG